jgi:hypothetical protein
MKAPDPFFVPPAVGRTGAIGAADARGSTPHFSQALPRCPRTPHKVKPLEFYISSNYLIPFQIEFSHFCMFLYPDGAKWNRAAKAPKPAFRSRISEFRKRTATKNIEFNFSISSP